MRSGTPLRWEALQHGGTSKLHQVLSKILYGCDLDSLYQSKEGSDKYNKKQKAKLLASYVKQTCGPSKRGVSFQDVQSFAMFAHLGKVLRPDFIYEVPASHVDLELLTAHLDMPASKRPRLTEGNDLRYPRKRCADFQTCLNADIGIKTRADTQLCSAECSQLSV